MGLSGIFLHSRGPYQNLVGKRGPGKTVSQNLQLTFRYDSCCSGLENKLEKHLQLSFA